MTMLGLRELQQIVIPGQLIIALNDRIVTNINALAGVVLNPNGTLSTISQAGSVEAPTEWATPRASSNGTGYEARVTETSGTLNQGDVTDEWLALTTLRAWGVQEMGSTITCTFLLEIRPIGGTVVVSCNVTVTSTYSA